MNTANKLTLLRIALIPVFVAVLLIGFPGADMVALVIFVAASLTDFADGYIARKYDQVTTFGKFVDPLADKLLITSAMMIFVGQGRLPAVAALIIIARELMVTSLRTVAMSEGVVVQATASGKFKMLCQVIMTVWLFLNPQAICFGEQSGSLSFLDSLPINQWVIWVTTAVTLWSGIDYLRANWSIVSRGLRAGKNEEK